jgi:thiamine kinase-like enzyme
MNLNNYGFVFNNITINNNNFIKQSKNLYGKIKINNEIDFYLYIIKNNICFPMPKLENYKDGYLSIEYIEKSSTLTNKITKINIYEWINKIKNLLNVIHNIQNPVIFNTIKRDLHIELNKKILDRFNEYEWHSNILFNSINTVNNVKIKDIFYYSDIIKSKVISHLNNRNYYNLIHGDIHLGNILLDKNDFYLQSIWISGALFKPI